MLLGPQTGITVKAHVGIGTLPAVLGDAARKHSICKDSCIPADNVTGPYVMRLRESRVKMQGRPTLFSAAKAFFIIPAVVLHSLASSVVMPTTPAQSR